MSRFMRDVPPFCNEMNGSCLLAAMLSAMHATDTNCNVSMRDLDTLVRDAEGRTSIARAVTVFNLLGFDAQGYASTFARVEERDLSQALHHGLMREQKIGPTTVKHEMARGSMVVCAIIPNAIYGNSWPVCGHAVAMTGYTRSEYIYHENGQLAHGPYGHINKHFPVKQFESGRAAHDHHTIIVRGMLPAFRKKQNRVLNAVRRPSTILQPDSDISTAQLAAAERAALSRLANPEDIALLEKIIGITCTRPYKAQAAIQP